LLRRDNPFPNDSEVLDFSRKPPPGGPLQRRRREGRATKLAAEEEESVPSFRLLRGLRELGASVEFRVCDGNSEWLPTAAWCPSGRSVGWASAAASRGPGDVVADRAQPWTSWFNQASVNPHGSALAAARINVGAGDGRGQLRKAGEGQPTIDRIEVAIRVPRRRSWARVACRRNLSGFFRAQAGLGAGSSPGCQSQGGEKGGRRVRFPAALFPLAFKLPTIKCVKCCTGRSLFRNASVIAMARHTIGQARLRTALLVDTLEFLHISTIPGPIHGSGYDFEWFGALLPHHPGLLSLLPDAPCSSPSKEIGAGNVH